MKYTLAAQLYWPIWLGFRSYDMNLIGMFAGVVVVLFVFRLMWCKDLEIGFFD
jgi:hypothetical protein